MTQVPPAGRPDPTFGDPDSPSPGSSSARSAAHTPAHAAEPTIGALAHDVTRHMSTLVRGEIELAKAEVRSSVRNAGAGVGMFIGAGVLSIFALTFGFIALAEGLVAIGLWRWLAYLVVFLFIIAVAAVLVWLGVRTVKKVKAPQRTIATTKDTVDFLKHPTAAA